MVVDVSPDQRPAAKKYEEQTPDRGVEQQTAEEQGERAVNEARVRGNGVDSDSVDADRGEATRLGPVDHHHAHEQRVDLVPCGEPKRDGRDDRNGRRPERADRGEHPSDPEHHPRYERDPAPHEANRTPDQQIDGPWWAADPDESQTYPVEHWPSQS